MSDLKNSISLVRNALRFIRPLAKLETDLTNLIGIELLEKNAEEVTKKHEERQATLKEQNTSLESQLVSKRETVREEIEKINKHVDEEKTKVVGEWDKRISQKKEELAQLQRNVNEASARYKVLETNERGLQNKVDRLKSVVRETETLVK